MDSDCLTIAVNFWWRSEVMSGMSEHMDAYYLRRILKRFLWSFAYGGFFLFILMHPQYNKLMFAPFVHVSFAHRLIYTLKTV